MSGAPERKPLQCWKCGADVSDARLPEAREERCPDCEADLHVCRMCRHFAPQLAGRCDEDRAEEVMNKERANFCDWFTPRAGAYRAKSDASDKTARERLERLFGGTDVSDKTNNPAKPGSALDDLFKKS